MGKSLGRFSSQHLPPETEKQMEGDLAGKRNLIYLHNAILMAPASSLHVSHHRAYLIHSAPGLLKPIHHPMASYLQGAWHTKLGLLSVIPATQAHTHNTRVDAHTLCVLLQIGIVWSPGNLKLYLPKSELISAKKKSGPAHMLGSSLVQPSSKLNASRILTVSQFKGFVPLGCDMKNICEKLKLGLSDIMF